MMTEERSTFCKETLKCQGLFSLRKKCLRNTPQEIYKIMHGVEKRTERSLSFFQYQNQRTSNEMHCWGDFMVLLCKEVLPSLSPAGIQVTASAWMDGFKSHQTTSRRTRSQSWWFYTAYKAYCLFQSMKAYFTFVTGESLSIFTKTADTRSNPLIFSKTKLLRYIIL